MAKSNPPSTSPSGRPAVARLTARQLLRQLGLILLVVAVWSGVLASFIALTGEPGEPPISQAPPAKRPTDRPAAAAPSAAPPSPTPASIATKAAPPTKTVAQEPAATASEPVAQAPSPTPLPTDEPASPPAEERPPVPDVSFSGDVLPILQSRCVQCHGPTRVSGDLRLDDYEATMAASESGRSVLPGDAANSLLVELILSGDMPRRGPRLTPAEIQIITDWVNAGAPDN